MRDPDREWTRRAACRGADPDLFLPREGPSGTFLRPPVEEALTYCEVCPVIAECAAEAEEYDDHGVRGGVYRTGARPKGQLRRGVAATRR